MDFFERVNKIEQLHSEGKFEEAMAECFALGESLRVAINDGKLTRQQAHAIINTIGMKSE